MLPAPRVDLLVRVPIWMVAEPPPIPSASLQITVTEQEGNLIGKPMWLIAIGSRRNELSLPDLILIRQDRIARFQVDYIVDNIFIVSKFSSYDPNLTQSYYLRGVRRLAP